MHGALRMFIMQILAIQLPFLADRNAELAVLLILLLYCCVPPLLWLVNCIIMEKNVALLSDLTVYSLYCALPCCILHSPSSRIMYFYIFSVSGYFIVMILIPIP